MSDYSRSPLDVLLANQQKGYVGLHIEQGVPLLDRDLNLLHDLITATVRSVITRYIGNGSPAGADGFAIQAIAKPQDFRIAAGASPPGTCLVGGIEVTIAADIAYTAQGSVPVLKTPTNAEPDPRTDIVYLDVSFIEVDGTGDADLNNNLDVGMQTSVRLKPVWVVRVSEGVPAPAAPAGHVFYALARMQRPRGSDTVTGEMITDLRQADLTVSAIERRLALVERLRLLPSFALEPNEFDPKFGPPGGDPVKLFGNNFDVGEVSVFFDSTEAKIVGQPTASQILVIVPNMAPVQGPGAKITVKTAAGTVTSVGGFVVDAAEPAFAASPNQFDPKFGGAGTQVKLLGTNFNVSPVSVLFGTVAALIVGTPTATQIVVVSPVLPGNPPFVLISGIL